MQTITILPEDLDLSSSSRRFLRLRHPRSGQPQLYLPYETKDGRTEVAEVCKVGGSGARRRTWFVGDSTVDSGHMLVLHRIDPLFLVIPIIAHLASSSTDAGRFQPLSDLIAAATSSPDLAVPAPFSADSGKGKENVSSAYVYNDDLERLLAIKPVRRVLRLCCERKVIPQVDSEDHATPQKQKNMTFYRPAPDKALSFLRAKVAHLAAPERFEQFDHLVRALNRDGLWSDSASDPNASLTSAARTKAAIEHIAQYLPNSTSSALYASYDDELAPLVKYLANRAAATAAAAQPVVNQGKDAKGTKRKAPVQASRGVEALKKVNTSKMAKLTSFFKPKDEKK